MPNGEAKRGAAARFLGSAARQRSAPGRVLPHVKVAFTFMAWVALVREQAMVLVPWPLYYGQALVVTAALALGCLMSVYLYPPRTARWRTMAWVFLASTVAGAVAQAGLGGRAGLLGALLGGALVLAARSEELGRRTVRRLLARRRADRA